MLYGFLVDDMRLTRHPRRVLSQTILTVVFLVLKENKLKPLCEGLERMYTDRVVSQGEIILSSN